MGKVFKKALRILIGLDERKGRCSGTRFSWDFLVRSWFFLPFSLASLTESYSFWYGLKDHFTLHKLTNKVVLDRLN